LHSTPEKDTSNEQKLERIKWGGTPKEFAQTFADLITDRKLFLNKSTESDTDPLVKLFHKFFFIPKEKGSGEITSASLSTYFKEYNATKNQ